MPLNDEPKKIIEKYGTTDNTTDIHVFYTGRVYIQAPLPATEKPWRRSWARGYTLSSSELAKSDQKYSNNFFVGKEENGLVAAHELAHLLVYDPEDEKLKPHHDLFENLLYTYASDKDAEKVTATKRLTPDQEEDMLDSPLLRD